MSQQLTYPEQLSPNHFATVQTAREELIQAVAKYAQPDYQKAYWQLSNTIIPYLGLWVLMIYFVSQGYPYWLTLLLAVPAGGLLVRIFIFFHDCTHGAFFPSRKANRILGYITGILVFTPFEDWQRTHVIHHSASGDLDRRGTGDVWTLTVEEYLAASRFKRLIYRLFRNPLVLFSIVPLFLFLLVNRFSSQGAGKRERRSVIVTNASLATLIIAMSLAFGWQNYLLVQLPVLWIAATTGMWMFYVQHQYEGVYWTRHESWDLTRSGLEGSSYYKLPKVLQWLVGNIGLHHIHHVRANIPNYNLQRCYNEVPALQAVIPLTIRKSFKSLWLNLWDEQRQKLVSFRAIKRLPRR
ncbi:MAG: fatty acid desaturase [Methylovulum sp.]|nr:fatty acid desaturase [Methylovulum sp.]